ncbi:MAG: hypothetical protein VX777_09440 [Chlamydiota bacterium]|nr:hypothetical protein [Chlamydiota bacterium]
MQNIPKSRLVLYVMIAGVLPLFFVMVNYWSTQNTLDELDIMIENIENKVINYKKQQGKNIAVINHYRDADHFYIDKYLETLNFLEPEIEALQKIVNHKNFTGDVNITKRMDFLTGSGNSMIFTEGVVQSYPLYQETTESLTHSIEVNVNDIKKILARVEGVNVGPYKPGPNRPQLIVMDFKIDKKQQPNENEIYQLNMKLLKREYM